MFHTLLLKQHGPYAFEALVFKVEYGKIHIHIDELNMDLIVFLGDDLRIDYMTFFDNEMKLKYVVIMWRMINHQNAVGILKKAEPSENT